MPPWLGRCQRIWQANFEKIVVCMHQNVSMLKVCPAYFCLAQADSDGEEKMGDCSRETLDQSCEHAREQLTNSIRQQWRKLRNHMEKLDSQGTCCIVT